MDRTAAVAEGKGEGVAAAGGATFVDRWFGKAILLVASVVMLTLALAPAGQFYLAWAGVVPWMLVVRRTRSRWTAFWWSWGAGTAFFLANMWWLAYVTAPGMVALMVYLGVYWGVAALILRTTLLAKLGGTPGAVRFVLTVAMVWAGLEWIRGNLFTGLPWLYLGHTQSPILTMCQVADVLGVQGISFWVASINALVFLLIVSDVRKRLIGAGVLVAGMTVAVLAYGVWREGQTKSVLKPGPVIAVVQSNYPQDTSGEKGASEAERLAFHVEATQGAVRAAGEGGVDLACWSETMMPGLNAEYRRGMVGARRVTKDGVVVDPDVGASLDAIVERLTALSRDYHVNVLAGALYEADLKDPDKFFFADRRNCAYLFTPDGGMAEERYDKVHLVPFGEFIPFKKSTYFHWIYSFFQMFSPYGDFDYTLTAGPEDAMTVFPVRYRGGGPGGHVARVVTPICFEDIDAGLCAKMFRGSDGKKRADVLINLTNDGWFKANENPQHLQAAIFRSIENRVPTARSVNTGISAFVDSTGRVTDKIAAQTAGTGVRRVMLDSRYTVFTRFGEWFAMVCAGGTVVMGAVGVNAWWRTRRKVGA